MKPADQRAFWQAVHVLGSAYRVEVTEELLLSWWTLLGDLPTPAVLAALVAAGKSCPYFPSPAQVRAHVPREVAPAPRWLEAAPPKPWTPEQKAEAEEERRKLRAAIEERASRLAAANDKPIRRRRKP